MNQGMGKKEIETVIKLHIQPNPYNFLAFRLIELVFGAWQADFGIEVMMFEGLKRTSRSVQVCISSSAFFGPYSGIASFCRCVSLFFCFFLGGVSVPP